MKLQHFFYGLLTLAVLFTACKKDIPVADITLNYEELTLISGDTIMLIATVQPNDATNKTVIWTSSNSAVATVNSEGMVTAIAIGEATITATIQDGNKTATCSVSVGIPVTGITLNYEELTLIPGDTLTLIATVQPDDATNKTVTWTSSNPEVATVNEEGLITAVANGEVTIIATTRDGDKIATCAVTVDYRSQWVGDWEFTTYPFGYIRYGEQADVVCIKFLEHTREQLVVVEGSGELLMLIPETTLYIYGKFEGANKVHFVFGEHSMGAPFKVTVDGIKKEGCKK